MTFKLLMKEMVSTYQAFEHYSNTHIKEMGLTMTQFDILVTLGNQPPMTCKELGEKTLVSKGTLTGVLERLQGKGLIEKFTNEEDGRSYQIGLSEAGNVLFQTIFPEHMLYLERAFGKLSQKDINQTVSALKVVKEIF